MDNLYGILQNREILGHETWSKHYRNKYYGRYSNNFGGIEYFVRRLELVEELKSHDACINTVRWNSSGTMIVSGSDDCHLGVWNISPQKGGSSKLVSYFKTLHRANIFHAVFVPQTNDDHIVSCALDCDVFYNILSRQKSQRIGTNRASCHKLDVISPSVFVTCSEDGHIKLIDMRDPSTVNSTQNPWKTNNSLVYLTKIEHTPSTTLLHDKNESPQPHSTYMRTSLSNVIKSKGVCCYTMSLNPLNNNIMAVGCRDQWVRLYDRRRLSLSYGKSVTPYCIMTQHACYHQQTQDEEAVTGLAWSYDGRELVASYSQRDIALFDLYTPKSCKDFSNCVELAQKSTQRNEDLETRFNDHPAQALLEMLQDITDEEEDEGEDDDDEDDDDDDDDDDDEELESEFDINVHIFPQPQQIEEKEDTKENNNETDITTATTTTTTTNSRDIDTFLDTNDNEPVTLQTQSQFFIENAETQPDLSIHKLKRPRSSLDNDELESNISNYPERPTKRRRLGNMPSFGIEIEDPNMDNPIETKEEKEEKEEKKEEKKEENKDPILTTTSTSTSTSTSRNSMKKDEKKAILEFLEEFNWESGSELEWDWESELEFELETEVEPRTEHPHSDLTNHQDNKEEQTTTFSSTPSGFHQPFAQQISRNTPKSREERRKLEILEQRNQENQEQQDKIRMALAKSKDGPSQIEALLQAEEDSHNNIINNTDNDSNSNSNFDEENEKESQNYHTKGDSDGSNSNEDRRKRRVLFDPKNRGRFPSRFSQQNNNILNTARLARTSPRNTLHNRKNISHLKKKKKLAQEKQETAPVGHVLLELHRKMQLLKQSTDDTLPMGFESKLFSGHTTVETIKECNFFGPRSEYVISGSDCGHAFIWKKSNGEIVNILPGDNQITNVVQGNPVTCSLVTSGLDDTVKFFTPTAENANEMKEKDEIINENQRRQNRLRARPPLRWLYLFLRRNLEDENTDLTNY